MGSITCPKSIRHFSLRSKILVFVGPYYSSFNLTGDSTLIFKDKEIFLSDTETSVQVLEMRVRLKKKFEGTERAEFD